MVGARCRYAHPRGWEKTGLSLSGSGQVRARARILGGYANGSSGLAEAVASFSFNTAPIVANPIADQSASYGAAFNFTVPANTFSDADAGQTLTYTTTATPTGAAGVYTIYVTLNDPDNKLGNYTVTTVTGALRGNPVSQTITFDPIPAYTYGDAPFVITATTGLDLPVTLASSAPTVATVNGNTITMVGAGTAIITATQTGDGSHNLAIPVVRTLTVAKALLTITADNLMKVE